MDRHLSVLCQEYVDRVFLHPKSLECFSADSVKGAVVEFRICRHSYAVEITKLQFAWLPIRFVIW
jgi:hypothetical protein